MKMMFNFHAESNAQAILKSMQKETIVAQNVVDLPKSSDAKITPHPNIVKMYTAFSDYIPELSESMELYPHALPPRINPQGKFTKLIFQRSVYFTQQEFRILAALFTIFLSFLVLGLLSIRIA